MKHSKNNNKKVGKKRNEGRAVCVRDWRGLENQIILFTPLSFLSISLSDSFYWLSEGSRLTPPSVKVQLL